MKRYFIIIKRNEKIFHINNGGDKYFNIFLFREQLMINKILFYFLDEIKFQSI